MHQTHYQKILAFDGFDRQRHGRCQRSQSPSTSWSVQTSGQDRANKIIGGGLAQIAPQMHDILMVEASFADRNRARG